MKKFILLFLVLTGIFILFPVLTKAAEASWCSADDANCCDESNGGTNGLVPCGKGNIFCQATITGGGVSVGDIIPCNDWRCTPGPASPEGASGCQRKLPCRCELYHVFFLALNVYKFVIWTIALPLAGLFVMIGGVLLLVGGGYPKLHDMGSKILWGTFWGLALILGAWLIINVVLRAIGYQGPWFTIF